MLLTLRKFYVLLNVSVSATGNGLVAGANSLSSGLGLTHEPLEYVAPVSALGPSSWVQPQQDISGPMPNFCF